MDKGKLMQRFREFCSALSPEDKVAIVHHSDADGFTSALIAAKAVEKLTGNRPVVVRHYEYGNRMQGRKAYKAMKKGKVNTVIVLDIGVDSAPGRLEDHYEFEKCLVIDHHKLYKDMGTEKTVFLKAQFFTDKAPSSYVTAKFAFDLFFNFR